MTTEEIRKVCYNWSMFQLNSQIDWILNAQRGTIFG